MKRLHGKVAAISGAAVGIGRACAFRMTAEGQGLAAGRRRARSIGAIAERGRT
jgi:NADP-dependent 3-hydroxy acid dehydrogenase YdfG